MTPRSVISMVAVLVVALAVAGGAFASIHRTSHVARAHHKAKLASYSANTSSGSCPNMGPSSTATE